MSKQWLAGILIVVSVLSATFFFYIYQVLLTPNLRRDQPGKLLIIPKGASFSQVLDSLKQGEFLDDPLSFAFLAKVIGYQEAVLPGAYMVQTDCSNKDLLWRLKKGRQTPIKFTFTNLRTKADLVKAIEPKLAATSEEIAAFLSNPDSCRIVGFDTVNVVSMFIPDTYELYYTTSVSKFMRRMQTEYNKFWTDSRKSEAKQLGLSQREVSVLASIVECETKKADEMPKVAGVYINRLRTHMKLGADPTVIFAAGDFSIKRVTHGLIQRTASSAYNTYVNEGLPPGPIYLPSKTALNAVLNATKHNYYYFCAKEDFSGYHNFATTYDEHLKYARIYAKALDNAGLTISN